MVEYLSDFDDVDDDWVRWTSLLFWARVYGWAAPEKEDAAAHVDDVIPLDAYVESPAITPNNNNTTALN